VLPLVAILLLTWSPWSARRFLLEKSLGIDLTARDTRITAARAAFERELSSASPDFVVAHQQIENLRVDLEIRPAIREILEMYGRLSDAKELHEALRLGDFALAEKRYPDAIEYYEKAAQVQALPAVETKLRKARALQLIVDARESIRRGDRSEAEAMLKQSIWLNETADAKKLLSVIRD
jgi:tetratricopeptide (TPR) repeat protein